MKTTSPERTLARQTLFRSVPILILAATLSSAAAAGDVKLSGPVLYGATGGDVERFAWDATGTRIVYLAQQNGQDLCELFSAPAGGGPGDVVQLSPTLVSGGGVQPDFAITPDGQRVVFRADRTVNEKFQVFSVPIDGSAPATRLSDQFPDAHSDVVGFVIAPDSQQIVYRANHPSTSVFELYSAAITGAGDPVRLSAGVAATAFTITPDSSTVVFHGSRLYSVPIDGSAAATELNGPLVTGGHVNSFRLAADGVHAVYRATQDSPTLWEGYAVRVDGSAPAVKLNGPIVLGGDVLDVVVSPLGDTALYYADQDVAGQGKLYSLPIDGSASPLELHATLPAHASIQADFKIRPAGDRVLYRVDGPVDDQYDLVTVPLDGSGVPTAVNGALPAGGDVASFGLTPDGGRVVYLADAEVDGRVELYSAPSDGSGAPVKLNQALAGGGRVTEFAIRADGARVAFVADPGDGERRLYSAPIDGGAVLQHSEDAGPEGGGVVTGVLLPGGHAVYLADPERVDTFELFAVVADGVSAPHTVNGELYPSPVVSDVDKFLVSPTGEHVIFSGDYDVDSRCELYSVALSPLGSRVKLNGPLPFGSFLSSSFLFTPDGSRVLYITDRLYSVPAGGGVSTQLSDGFTLPVLTADGQHAVYKSGSALYSVPVDGSSPPLLLTPPSMSVIAWVLSPDGLTVVVSAAGGVHRAPLDGSQVTVRLTPVVGGNLAISPDGNWVIFKVGNDLYSTPMAGVDASVKLNGPSLQGPMMGHAVTPDSSSVVYLARELSVSQELLRVPIDGSAPPVRVNSALPPGGNLASDQIQFSPDGTRVLYRADAVVDEVYDLYVAALGGGSPPVQITELAVSRSILDFKVVAPDRVLYRANPDLIEAYELFSARLSGVGDPLLLHPFLGPVQDVEDGFSSNGQWVVFRADLDTVDRIDCYAVPANGDAAPRRLNGPLVDLGTVTEVRLPSAGDFAFYRASQDTFGAFELYMSRLPSNRFVEAPPRIPR